MHSLIVPANMKPGVFACFTDRHIGADLGRIADRYGFTANRTYLPIQRHTDTVLVIKDTGLPEVADAVITAEKGLLLGVRVADCVPILLADPVRAAVGAVHAGWRGTAAAILKKTIQAFSEAFGSDPSEMLMAIGPSIRRCCYEVGSEVVKGLEEASGQSGYVVQRGEKFLVDLAAANALQAVSMGLHSANIWSSPDCTFCSPERFFSYRHSGGEEGRQAACIGLI